MREKANIMLTKEEIEDKAQKYVSYRGTDFAADAYFLRWRLLQDKESSDFWASYQATHPEQKAEIVRAIALVKSVRFKREKFSDGEKREAIGRLTTFIHRQKRARQIRMYSSIAAAVVLVAALLVGVTYLQSSDMRSELTAQTYVVPQDQEIYLVAENDQVVPIADQSQIVCAPDGGIAVDGEMKDSLSQMSATDKVSMRKLVVPDGKRTFLQLADGTKVWVNSGTTLEFPSSFTGSQRHIAVDGEIYLEVTPDKEKPFIVSTPLFDVRVLGTKFGISAYKQMNEQNVVLVEGAVQVSTKSGNQTTLEPSQMFNLVDGQVSTKQVNPYSYISWKDDVLYFNGESLQEVFFRLSKQYAVSIACKDGVHPIRMYGKLVLEEHIEQVLDNIAVLSPIEYRVENNRIIVNKR